MAVSVATAYLPLVSSSVRALPWKRIGWFATYQWYDDASEITVSNNRVQVVRAIDHKPTLMRLRVIGDRSITSEEQESVLDEKMHSEINRRLSVRRAGSDSQDTMMLRQVIAAEVYHEEQKKWTSSIVPTETTDPICRALPFIRNINSLAATVALLHLYRDQKDGHLPALPPQVQPKFERIEAKLSDHEVFER